MDATAKMLAIIAIAAFVTERILAAVNYLLNAVRLTRLHSRAAARFRTRELRKLLLTGIAAIIAYVVVDRANIRLLSVVQIANVPPLVDFWLTWLVVVAGADRVRGMLGGSGGGGGSSPEKSEAPVVRVRVDGGDIHELHRAG